jgi:hypothetical protein
MSIILRWKPRTCPVTCKLSWTVMTVYQTPSDVSLSERINAELTGGVMVTVDRYESGAETVHGLVIQHGVRRRIVQRPQPFSDVDVADIVAAARRWADAVQEAPRSQRWVDDHVEADAMPE